MFSRSELLGILIGTLVAPIIIFYISGGHFDVGTWLIASGILWSVILLGIWITSRRRRPQ